MKMIHIPEPVRWVCGRLAAYRRKLLFGFLCLLGSNLLNLLAPAVLQRVIDSLRLDITRAKLIQYGALLVLIALVRGVVLVFQRRLIIGVARDLEYQLRNELYEHLQRLPTSFYQEHRTGDLMARATADLSIIRNAIGMGLISVSNMIFTLMLILPIMLWVSWKLTLLASLPLPLLALTTRFFSARIHQRSRLVQEHFGALSSSVQEMLAGQRVIRAYVQEEAEQDKFRAVNQEYVAHNLSLIHLASIFRPLLQFFVGLSFIVVFLYGGHLIIKGQLTVGMFVQQTMYLGLLVGPIASFGFVINLYQRALASLGRIEAILSTEPAIRDAERAHTDLKISGEIEFRNLSFTYDGARRPALKGLNLHITPGQTVAIVGRIGSGKTTLMQLISRLIDADAGQLLIDGHSIRDIPLAALRSAIGYVPQETILFSETVAENISFGRDDAAPEEIEWAAVEAGVAGDISGFPKGYETLVGERGVMLSGGQKQRLAIARALIRRPRILLLDDALSSVDVRTEEQILKHLRRARQGRTSLISSHRLSTIKDADLIIVLEDGRIAESGRHEELMALGGLYAGLYRRQLLEADLAQN